MNITAISLRSGMFLGEEPPTVLQGYPFIEIPLIDVDPNNPYLLKAATGFEAPELGVQLGSRQNATNFGALTPREISILVGLNPSYDGGKTFSDLRDDIYRIINPGGLGLVHLMFIDGTTNVAYLNGYVSKMDASVFTGTPEIVLTITCDDPMIKAYEEESYLDMDPTPVLGGTLITDTKSTAPHGFLLDVEFTDAADYFEMVMTPPALMDFRSPTSDAIFRIDYQFVDEDILHINTNYGELSVILEKVSGGITSHLPLGDHITSNSVWPAIFPMYNVFDFTTELLDPLPYSITSWTHVPTYWGI